MNNLVKMGIGAAVLYALTRKKGQPATTTDPQDPNPRPSVAPAGAAPSYVTHGDVVATSRPMKTANTAPVSADDALMAQALRGSVLNIG